MHVKFIKIIGGIWELKMKSHPKTNVKVHKSYSKSTLVRGIRLGWDNN